MTRARPLVLSGPMGVGKTTVGRRLAARLGIPFVDLDEAIEQEAGMTVADLFVRDGEAGFRARERVALQDALSSVSVVAAGGGTLVDRALRREALDRAIVVSLDAPVDALLARLGEGERQKRPLLSGDAAGDVRGRLSSLVEARGEAYAEAHARVPTAGREIDAIAADIEAVARRAPVAVPLGARTYRVEVGGGLRALLPEALRALGGDAILVTDDVVWPLVRERMPRVSYRAEVVLPAGEAHKTIDSVARIWDAALSCGIDRRTVLVAVGGGVIGDLTGFAAATLLRGVRFVQLPTTLLAMVDASVGGKTAVDRPQGKNLVGAFHQPSLVIADTELLETLPSRELRSGLAEVVKTALIGEPSLLELLEDPALDVPAIVRASVALKARVVSSDERDETGVRASLNFGHTVGHALEAHGGYARLTHGEAVGLGMIAALRIGVARGVTPPSLLARTEALLARLGLPVDLDAEPVAEALPRILSDKKREGARVAFVLLEALGRPVNVPLTFDEVRAALRM